MNPSSRGLKGFKRGHLNLAIAGGNPGQNLLMGSGCNYSSCASPPNYESDVYPTYSQWTWIVTSTVGVGNNSWTAQPIRAQRTLVFYR